MFKVSLFLGNYKTASFDLASCDFLTSAAPPGSPTCNEMYALEFTTHKVYNLNPTTLATTLITTGSPPLTTQNNLSFGPLPSDLNKNQFVTSPHSGSGPIYTDVNNTGSLTNTGFTWGSAIGLGTDPATGIVWGISGKNLTKWTGTGNATSLGNISGDGTWNSGTICNDIAVDAGGNLYCMVFKGANTYLYRINPTTVSATLVVQATGTFITDGTVTNGNGLSYLGDYFYYSRLNGPNTDLWRLDAVTGVSEYVGLVGIQIGDLGSCATVTQVPAEFTFNCGAAGGGLQEGNFLLTGGVQNNILRVPITNAINGLGLFTVTAAGSGISANPSPYQLNVPQGATYIDLPIVYDGTGSSGSRALSVTVASAIYSSTCAMNITIDPCDAGNVAPILSATNKANICPATTINLSTITASNNPGGLVILSWHNGIPATNANKLSSITALPEGTYYAAFYDPTNDCYSGINGAGVRVVNATVAYCCDASSSSPPLNKN